MAAVANKDIFIKFDEVGLYVQSSIVPIMVLGNVLSLFCIIEVWQHVEHVLQLTVQLLPKFLWGCRS